MWARAGSLHCAGEFEDAVVRYRGAVDNHANWTPANDCLANGSAMVADDWLELFNAGS